MKNLYFVRHGQSEFNVTYKWAGTTDCFLTPTGKDQAKRAGKKLQTISTKIDVIISSPLLRAHHTAKIIADQINHPKDNIILNSLLVERNYGELEGRATPLIASRYVKDESHLDEYKDVEKLIDMQKRADNALQYLESLTHDNILVVSHGAFGRALRRSIKKDHISTRGKSFKNAELEKLI